MKNIFRAIGFGAAVVAFSATSSFAQANPCEDPFETKNAEYQKFRENIKSPITIEKLEIAVASGDGFNTRYAACEDTKPIVKYITDKMPAVKETLVDLKRTKKFNDGVNNGVWADAFSAGKEIVSVKGKEPISLDVAIVLAMIGFDQTSAKNDTFNNDSIAMAETVIKKIESGMTSEKYGAFGKYELKTTAFPDGKQNALGWMNYIIGYIKGERQGNKKEGLAYYHKAVTKSNSAIKGYPEVFQAIGDFYVADFNKIEKERGDLYKANGDKEDEKTLAMWDLQKGYLDRAIDAYARAYNAAAAIEKAAPADKKAAAKTYKDNFYKFLGTLYKNRFDKTDGLDPFISAQISKPMPDPTSEVMPVKEVAPTATTTTTNPTSTTTKPTDTTTKPTSTTTTTTKPTDTMTKPTSTTTTKPTSSTTPKKPVTKKKSGR